MMYRHECITRGTCCQTLHSRSLSSASLLRSTRNQPDVREQLLAQPAGLRPGLVPAARVASSREVLELRRHRYQVRGGVTYTSCSRSSTQERRISKFVNAHKDKFMNLSSVCDSDIVLDWHSSRADSES